MTMIDDYPEPLRVELERWKERALDAEAKLKCMTADRDYWQNEYERDKHYPEPFITPMPKEKE